MVTDLEPLGVEGGVLTILVKQDVHRRYLENKAVDTFQEAAQAVTGRLLGLKFVEEGELESPLLPATSMLVAGRSGDSNSPSSTNFRPNNRPVTACAASWKVSTALFSK